MIFSRRDFTLVMIMLGVLLAGFSYLLGAPLVRDWIASTSLRERFSRELENGNRMLGARPEWEQRISTLRATLPTYRADERVEGELLKQVRRLADENRVVTTRITPDQEVKIGDLFEQAIEVTWEASLEPLVRFLYAVQVAGATLDIRQITVTPSQGDLLKGNFKIYFAYQRGPATGTDGEDDLRSITE